MSTTLRDLVMDLIKFCGWPTFPSEPSTILSGDLAIVDVAVGGRIVPENSVICPSSGDSSGSIQD